MVKATPTEKPSDWLKTSEFAHLLNVHPKSVARWVREGRFQDGEVKRLGGECGEYRIRRSAHERFLVSVR